MGRSSSPAPRGVAAASLSFPELPLISPIGSKGVLDAMGTYDHHIIATSQMILDVGFSGITISVEDENSL